MRRGPGVYGVGTEAEWDQVADGILRECPAGDTRAQPSAAGVGVALAVVLMPSKAVLT